MRDKLKPCPFCGSNDISATPYPDIYGAAVCKYCGCGTPYGILKERIELWNTRPIEDALQAELDQLRADNQALVQQVNALAGKLEKAIEILADNGSIACPAIKIGYECNNGNGCNRLYSVYTVECWREYFEKGDDK